MTEEDLARAWDLWFDWRVHDKATPYTHGVLAGLRESPGSTARS